MWERFSFYGMRAILILFLVDKVKGGLGLSDTYAIQVYSIYTASVYGLCAIGGIIADKWIGKKNAVLCGGGLACIGHFLLAMQNEPLFMVGLFCISAGTGLLKPNISTLVGDLYQTGSPKRDAGFTIFYIGINIGGFFAPLLIGWIAETFGWHYGFGLAGACMLFGIFIFIWGQKFLSQATTMSCEGKQQNQSETEVSAKTPLTKIEKDRLWGLLFSFIAVFIFFVAFEQAGGLMNLYTNSFIDRHILGWEIPASVFQAVNPFFIILLGPILELVWRSITKYVHISSFYKLGIGNLFVGIGFLFMVMAA